jgi:uncharacterized cupredoxin-like copper-binding protein
MRGPALVLAVLLLAVPVAAQDDGETREVEVALQDEGCPDGPDRFCVDPGAIKLGEGRDLVLEVTNEGQVRHNLTAGPQAPDDLAQAIQLEPLAPNETAELRVAWTALEAALDEGESSVELACGFDGHADLGERLTVEVEGGDQQPQPAAGALAALGVLSAVAALRARA